MIDYIDSPDGFESSMDQVGASLEDTAAVAATFGAELKKMASSLDKTGASVGSVSSSISGGFRRAFEGLAFDGMKASDALQLVGKSIVSATYSAAIRPVSGQIGDMIANGIAGIGVSGFADGGSFAQGRVLPFAKGGVVTGPTVFPMRSGTGLMGEAGAEAIMPLSRGPDGSLGVRAQGGSSQPVQVVMNVTTQDAGSFQRSRSQIAAQVGRAIGHGQRNR
jgi:hypothetical protein